MNYVLFDDASRENLLPLTLTRPVADIRIGIITIREKWEMLLGVKTSSLTQGCLSKKFPLTTGDEMILINGSVIPNRELIEKIRRLVINESLVQGDIILARRIKANDLEIAFNPGEDKFIKTTFDKPFEKINFPWDIFSKNADAISNDFKTLTEGKKSQKLEASNIKIGQGDIRLFKQSA